MTPTNKPTAREFWIKKSSEKNYNFWDTEISDTADCLSEDDFKNALHVREVLPETQNELAKLRLENEELRMQLVLSKPIYSRRQLETQNANLTKLLDLAVDALEFVAMPITSNSHTVDSLLETIETDIQKASEALTTIAGARVGSVGGKSE